MEFLKEKEFIQFVKEKSIGKLFQEIIPYKGKSKYVNEYFSRLYYISGIDELDKILSDNNIKYFASTSLLIYILSYERYIFINIETSDCKPFAIWGFNRSQIKDLKITENVPIKVRYVNKINQELKSSPVLGIVPNLVGHYSDKLIGDKSKDANGTIFSIILNDENNNNHEIKFSSNSDTAYYPYDLRFFKSNIKSQISDEDVKDKDKLLPRQGCYIATACYGNVDAPEVEAFRKYRDEFLSKYLLGRVFIRLYYTISPFFAERLKRKSKLNKFIRHTFLDRIYRFLLKRI